MIKKQNGKATDNTTHQTHNDVDHVHDYHPSTSIELGTGTSSTKCVNTSNEVYIRVNEDGKPLEPPPPKSTSHPSSTSEITTKTTAKTRLIVSSPTRHRDVTDLTTYNRTANKDQIRANRNGTSFDNIPSP